MTWMHLPRTAFAQHHTQTIRWKPEDIVIDMIPGDGSTLRHAHGRGTRFFRLGERSGRDSVPRPGTIFALRPVKISTKPAEVR